MLGNNKGTNKMAAKNFPGTARGNNKTKAPSMARLNVSKVGSGSHSMACGQSLIFSKAHHNSCMAAALSFQKNPAIPICTNENNKPSKASGTTTKLIHGIPTILVSGPRTEVWPKNHNDNGNKPSKAIHWDFKNSFICSLRLAAIWPGFKGRHQTNQATPTKLSQNPADNTASGSDNKIAIKANAKDCEIRIGRLESFAIPTTAIIKNVRHVGNAKPANAV